MTCFSGASHASIAPYGPFACAGGEVVFFGIQNEREWEKFCEVVLEQPELAASLIVPGRPAKLERIVVIEVQSFDWNCPKYITPRYTRAEVEQVVAPLRARIAELEARLAGRK